MPFNREYTPARRVAMTTIVWAILGGSVALAAWACRYPVDPHKHLSPTERVLIRTLERLTEPATRPG
jgi:hypothetical protein